MVLHFTWIAVVGYTVVVRVSPVNVGTEVCWSDVSSHFLAKQYACGRIIRARKRVGDDGFPVLIGSCLCTSRDGFKGSNFQAK